VHIRSVSRVEVVAVAVAVVWLGWVHDWICMEIKDFVLSLVEITQDGVG
jgi:hypothetical protein